MIKQPGKAPVSPAGYELVRQDMLAAVRTPRSAWPARLGRYHLRREIARGGMGTVFEAVDLRLDRRIALKILRDEGAGPESGARFRREASIASRLHHPNIIAVHDVGTEDDGSGRSVSFIAMDLIAGPTFAEVLESRRLPRNDLIAMLETVARAAAIAHAGGVVHRDLKPSNILLDPERGPILSDFGLARVEDPSVALTRTQAVMGTPQYMAPEQVEGKARSVDARTDVYAIGVVLYEILAGRLPFRAATPAQLYHQILHQEPHRPSTVAALVERDIERVCLKAMEKEPGRRYGTALELAEDLRRFLSGEAVLAKPPGAVRRARRFLRGHRVLAASLAIACVAAPGLFVADRMRADALAREHAREAERILATLPSAPARPGPERLAAIHALISADRHLQRADRPDLRYTANRRLAALALDGADYALARIAFAVCRDIKPEEDLEPLVDAREQEELSRRRRRLGEILDDLRQGLGRVGRPADAPLLEDFVLECIPFADGGSVGVLAEALRPLRDRATADAAWTQEDRDVMTFCFRVLGRIDDDAVVAPLAGLMGRLRDHSLAVECGLALCNTRRAAAQGPLLAARNRLGGNSPTWRQIARLFGRVPCAPSAEPRTAEEYEERALIRYDKLDFAGAREDATRAIELKPDFAAAFVTRGNARRSADDAAGAMEDYARAIELEPGHGTALNNRANLRAERGDVEGALADFARAIALDPRDPLGYINRSFLRADRGDLQGAIDDATRAIELDPQGGAAFVNRGSAFQVLGDLDRAAADFSRAIDVDPHNAIAFSNRGAIRVVRGDWDGAIADCTRAIELDPAYVSAFDNRANARRQRGDFEGALADAERAIELRPDQARSHVLRGLVCQDRGRPLEAIAAFSRAIELSPGDAAPYNHRGVSRHESGDVDGALADFDRCIALDPRSSEAHNHRGMVRHDRNDRRGALEDFTRAVELDPRNAAAWNNRAGERRAAGDREGAIADWERFLMIAPDHPQAARVRELLKQARARR